MGARVDNYPSGGQVRNGFASMKIQCEHAQIDEGTYGEKMVMLKERIMHKRRQLWSI